MSVAVTLVAILLGGLSTIRPVDASTTVGEEFQDNIIDYVGPINSDPLLTWDQREVITYSSDILIVKFLTGAPLVKDNPERLAPVSPTFSQLLRQYDVLSIEAVIPQNQHTDSIENKQIMQQFGLERIYRLQLSEESDLLKAADAFSASPDVEWAEPDYIAHAAFIPNDPKYPDQWGPSKIEAEQAWDVTQGSPSVAIAIIDTGIDFNHPDLASKLWINPGEIANNGIDDDGNGKVDDINGWDWVENDKNPMDDIGHGTHVAGVTAAATNNSIGVAGVCPNCRVMALKVLDAGGSGTYSNIAAGIIYAADKGAKVINLSLGGYADSSLLRDAVAYASQYAVVVAASGNDNKQDRFYPAAYDDYVLAVAATDNNDQKTAFSNYGEWVDISAPGVSIWSTLYNDTYGSWSGSSMAVPFVSGVAGLIRSKNPSWSAGAARGQLLHTTDGIDTINPGYEGKLGVGRVNANQAVTASAQPELSVASYSIGGVVNGRPEPGSSVTMTLTLENRWADAMGVTASLSTTDTYVTISDGSASYGDIDGFQTITNTSDTFGFTVDPAAPVNHPIIFRLILNGGAGHIDSLTITITTATGIVNISGVLSQDTTWSSDKIYMITGDTLVPSGIRLTILPGVTIKFDTHKNLMIEGELIADGTKEKPIIFTSSSLNPTYASWGSIRFRDSSVSAIIDSNYGYISGSIIRFAKLEYGSGLFISYSAPYISNVVFYKEYSTYPYGTDIENVYQGWQCNGMSSEDGSVYIYDPDTIFIMRDSHFIDLESYWLIYPDNLKGVGVKVQYSYFDTVFINNVFEEVSVAIVAKSARSKVYSNVGKGSSFCVNEVYDSIAKAIDADLMMGNAVNYLVDYHRMGVHTVISNTIVNAGTLVNEYGGTYNSNNLILGQGYYFYLKSNGYDVNADNNYWGTMDRNYIDQHVWDYYDDFNLGKVTYTTTLNSPVSTAPAFITNFLLEPLSPLGTGPFSLTLDFSKPMSSTVQPTVTFGINPSYNTHIVSGDWVSSTRWIGTNDVSYYTGDGIQRLRVAGAREENNGKEILEDTRFTFEIATIGATSINAEPGYGHVALSWNPSDLETVAGYNLYRSTTPGGPYTRLNSSVMTTTSYTDTNVINGTPYYYVVKLLTTDLYEMDFGSETAATPNDYSSPSQPVVSDDGSCTPYTDHLYATWLSTDPDSGIAEYQYSIGTWAGGTDVINWTSTGTNTEVNRTGLSLIDGVTYFFNAKAKNGVGAWSLVGNSDGILVSAGCPSVSFSADPTSGNRPLSVQFTDQSVGSVISHLWEFGDGIISTEINPSHTYNTTGSFTVTLIVTGTVSTNQKTIPACINVGEAPPVADFLGSPREGVAPLNVVFTDTTTGFVDAWLWDFGDQFTSTETSPSHSYTEAGTYTVTLSTSGPGGGDTEIKEAYVTAYTSAQASFSASPTSGAAPLTVSFSNTSVGDFTTSLWDFGDGITSTLQSPMHTFTVPGVFTVSLTINGPGGLDLELSPEYISVTGLKLIFLPIVIR